MSGSIPQALLGWPDRSCCTAVVLGLLGPAVTMVPRRGRRSDAQTEGMCVFDKMKSKYVSAA